MTSTTLYKQDLPHDLNLGPVVAIDTETMGLNPHRDRLCLIQLSSGDGHCHIVQIERGNHQAPNLLRLLNDQDVLKLFHFARFDMAVLRHHFEAICLPVYCTKIASKLARTYTDRHGLKDLCQELLGIDLSKQMQSSDWGRDDLSKEQLAYAAHDVLYLHRLQARLEEMLEREQRQSMAKACFDFLPRRVALDLAGFANDIFAH